MNRLKTFVQRIFNRLGFVLLTSETHNSLVLKSQYARKYAILARLGPHLSAAEFASIVDKSHSQLDQDLAALAVSGMKTGGFFVEFGATDGQTLSNTYLLEKHFGWNGILAEPGLEWQEKLKANRRAAISSNAVWAESGQTLEFIENAELSTLLQFKNSDQHIRKGRTYGVRTISLNDLLEKNKAPKFIDFMSVDTEGSEYEVLKAFDFGRYKFGFICIEHNYTSTRALVLELMDLNGYKRVLEDMSEWDDWFVPKD